MTAPDHRRRVLATTAGLGTGGLVFFLVLLDLGRDLLRTALPNGYFSGAYDLQARALLDGHIAVPEGSMGLEGFVMGDKTFMYFPPFPAILRIPVLLTTDRYDGRLTLLSMALAWVFLAVVVTKLAWLVLALVTGRSEVSRTGAVLMAVFLAGATGGTFLTFDASLPWVYDEVYLWAVAATVGAFYWMVRATNAPDRRAARWLGICALIAVGTRATEGWAVCFGILVLAVWMRWWPRTAEHRRLWWRVAVASLVPLGLSIALNLYKFNNAYLFPLQNQVWTGMNAHRREALAANDGTLTGLQFFTTSFMAYFRPDGIRFTDYFPWISFPAVPAQAYGGAVVDQTYRTGSVTTFMTLFLLLTALSVLAVVGPWARPELRIFRLPLATGIFVTGGVMAYGYVAPRYASDFVPALVLGAAVGFALLARTVHGRRRIALPTFAVVGTLTAFALVAQVAVGLSAAAFQARGQTLERYLSWQRGLSGTAQSRLVTATDGLPSGGRADQLAVRGDCDALYLNTGDRYEPWVTVVARDVSVRIEPGRSLKPGSVRLLRITGTDAWISLQVNRDGEIRFVLANDDGAVPSDWAAFPPEGHIDLGVRNLTDYSGYEINASVLGVVGYLSSTEFDDDGYTHPTTVVVDDLGQAGDQLGLRISRNQTVAPPLCESLRSDASAAEGR